MTEAAVQHGAWGSWGSWSTCSLTCGSKDTQGLRSRTRVCDNPAPVGPGKPCPGADRQTEVCYPPQCPTCQVHNVPGATASVSAARIYENEYVRYYCLPEHKLVSGSLKRTCQADGTLTNEEPQCKKCCGKARFIMHGYPDTSASLCYGDHVNYLCDRGYKSSNSTPIVCSSPYEWKYIPLPKCEPTGDCDPNDIQPPQGGHKACSAIGTGKACYMRCGDGQTYTGGSDVFECNVKTDWAWQVRVLGGAGYMPSAVGMCQVSDSESGFLAWVEGLETETTSTEPEESLEESIMKEMRQKLADANICTASCTITDITIEASRSLVRRDVVSQARLFSIKVAFYASPPKGSVTSQQTARIELSKALKSLKIQADAFKQAIVSGSIVLQIGGAPARLKGDNIRVSKPFLTCLSGSIRKGFNCFTCPVGTYHNKDEKQCSSCPFGQYQDQPGQMSCKLCPNGTTTDRLGISNVTHCREYEGCNCGIHPCKLNGSKFECNCLPGYENINGTCKDIDECNSDICPVNARCINKEGSYRCECLTGYDGNFCTDVDECKYPDSCPSSGMQCINTVGSYKCACLVGYYGNNCDQRCPDGFIETNKRCLFVSAAVVTHSNASQLCGSVHPGAHLVDIKDKVTYKTVTSFLNPPNSYWMGLNDKEQEGTFVYSDGSKVDTLYNEWDTGLTLPASNDRTKNCAVMDGNTAFQWRVVPCDESNYAVCEFDKV
ncbi:signal peptide, CUB and EGF-like domain-containing protein 2 [Lingula anatina]|uniref:Signal peptide, CUB and EGF-like domain-containing protein 2 n=1 Tax=Lingula anatina TaxID=7574 RepID=A0A1S3J779_LINAN|nr:signal peptide, CUB and EGF-like domain-containing protein 2 [Lingula anatina]|eukprot:XP_013406096.1 signal peptide, CUB and EGF-like domain-containing protein 2 [Lingula anatina]